MIWFVIYQHNSKNKYWNSKNNSSLICPFFIILLLSTDIYMSWVLILFVSTIILGNANQSFVENVVYKCRYKSGEAEGVGLHNYTWSGCLNNEPTPSSLDPTLRPNRIQFSPCWLSHARTYRLPNPVSSFLF